MKVVLLTPKQWMRSRKELIQRMSSWGGGRLSTAGLATLQRLQPEELDSGSSASGGIGGEPIAAVAVVLQNGRLAGAAFASRAGREACLVAVSPAARGRGAGTLLLLELQKQWNSLACRVAADNAASMRMCFNAGMIAVGMTEGPTGKPTLLFQTGENSSAAAWQADQERLTAIAECAAAPESGAFTGPPSLAKAKGSVPEAPASLPSPPAALLREHGAQRRNAASRSDDSGKAHTRHFNLIPR